MEHIAMNREERDRLEWLKRAQDEVITQGQAAERMGASDRWVRQRLVRVGTWDDGVVVHGLRGPAPRPSNRRAGGCLCGLPEQGGFSFRPEAASKGAAPVADRQHLFIWPRAAHTRSWPGKAPVRLPPRD